MNERASYLRSDDDDLRQLDRICSDRVENILKFVDDWNESLHGVSLRETWSDS